MNQAEFNTDASLLAKKKKKRLSTRKIIVSYYFKCLKPPAGKVSYQLKKMDAPGTDFITFSIMKILNKRSI